MEQNKIFDSLLQDISKIRNEETITVRLPYSGRTATFKVLSAEQQKTLIQFGLEKNVGKVQFLQTLGDIVKDNTNGAISMNQIYNIDKYSIFYAVKSAFIKDLIAVNLDDTVKISPVLEKNKEFVFPEELKTKVFKIGSNEVTLAPYSLAKDRLFNISLDSTIGNSEKQGKIVGEIYIYELAKYIQSVKIGENVLTEADLKPAKALELLSAFPTTILSKFIDYINDIKKVEENYAVIDGYTVSIDGSFFV